MVEVMNRLVEMDKLGWWWKVIDKVKINDKFMESKCATVDYPVATFLSLNSKHVINQTETATRIQ